MQRGLGTAAFEWEASHSKRALAFPHERHRGYRLKVPSGRWRIRAVQEAIASDNSKDLTIQIMLGSNHEKKKRENKENNLDAGI